MRQFKLNAFVSSVAVAFACGVPPALADDDVVQQLLETLRAKGTLTEAEAAELQTKIEARRAETRAEARKQRQREATEAGKRANETSGTFRDGFLWESADKANSISLNGRIHADFRQYGGVDAINTDTFDVRRAYIGARGKFQNNFEYEVTADVAQTEAPQLDVAWINWIFSQSVQLRAGQFKMPMSIEELTSSRFIDFQERSFVNRFAPAKERGLAVHGEPMAGVFYGIALSNGAGKNANETDASIDDMDLIGRIGVNLAQIFGKSDMVLHLAVATSSGELPVTATVPKGRTEARGITFFSSAAFDGTLIDRERQHLEASIAYGPVKLQFESMDVSFEGKSVGGVNFNRSVQTAYASLNWLVTGESYARAYRTGAYGRIVPLLDFNPAKEGGTGAIELGVRFSRFDASDFTLTNLPGTGLLGATSTNQADAVTVGLKWIVNPNVRFMLNVVNTDFDTPVTVGTEIVRGERGVMLRAGLDF
jgi:phosphate-selective porin OprO/OprP